MQTQFETVIGLEVHIQLNTASKAFSREPAIFGQAPNTVTHPVSLAHPGVLPVSNLAHIHSAVKLGLALQGEINLESHFDRKHYFYADSPKGYQITQDSSPIVIGGQVELSNRHIRLHHIHMEDDAGKSMHDQHPTLSYVDLNRAGTPLLELVTEPDFRSGEEVSEFLEYLRKLVRWLQISDGNMEEGSLRCDVNISLRPVGSPDYGQRCEVKNMNSIRFARKAIEFEVNRQTKLLLSGALVEQQTRGFNAQDGSTYALRDKEDAHDYRYFPDPDLPPVVLTEKWIESVRSAMPDLPKAIEKTLMVDYLISPADAEILTSERSLADCFLHLLEGIATGLAKPLAQLFIQKVKPWVELNALDYRELKALRAQIHALVELMSSGKVQHSAGYQKLVPAWLERPTESPELVAQELDLLMQPNETLDIPFLAQQVLDRNPEKVAEYKKGKKSLIGMFMGELMRDAKGKANAQEATKALIDLLEVVK